MRQDLTTGPVTRTMLLFALPMILGNILQQCYNLADTWIVGRFISTDALGAVGSAYTLMTFLTPLILGMCMGAGALFSISYGGKDLRRLGEYIASAFVLIVGLTVVLTGVSYGLLPSILRWMRTPEDVYPMMYAYVQVILVGLPFIFLYNYFAFLLRAVGNSLVPLVFLGVSTVLNIGLDVLLVAVIPYGVAGAAAATVIAQGGGGGGHRRLYPAAGANAAPGVAGARACRGGDLRLCFHHRGPAVGDELRHPHGAGAGQQLRHRRHGRLCRWGEN